MGLRISWVGFKGLDKAAILTHLRFRDTGVIDEANEAPFSLAEIPTGWSILFSNDFDYASAEHLVELSTDMTIVACQVHEGIMFSSAYGYTDRQAQWSVWHEGGEREERDLVTQGDLPAAFDEIRQRLASKQDGEMARRANLASSDPVVVTPPSPEERMVRQLLDGYQQQSQTSGQPLAPAPAPAKVVRIDPANMPVDYIFDVPVELAESMTGYRHDRVKFSWGAPSFTVVERLRG